MNVNFFLDRIEEVLPPGKPQTPLQMMAYREKLARFNSSQLAQLCEAVIENCKFWPKIADIYEQARLLGMFAHTREDIPHTWEPSDCARCAGSGLIAVFWSQEFEFGDSGPKSQTLRVHYLVPYHESWDYGSRRDHDDVRSVFRCDCVAGEAKTLPTGVARWNRETCEIRRGWGR